MIGDGMSDDELWAAMPPHSSQTPKAPEPIRIAFYGRCSTEDLQDPKTSLEWQLAAAKNLISALRLDAEIVSTYFDIGVSRSVPWKRRPQGGRLMTDLRSPDRPWNAVIVGEGQRCWSGSQFLETAPLFHHHGVRIYIPDLGGAYDPKNSTHFALMSVSGGMSAGERQRVQERVRMAMSAQVEIQGRFQGGRAPFGYDAVGFAPHPNQKKANEGAEIKRLEIVETEAVVVRRIFDEFLENRSLRDIANRLNADGVPSPSVVRGEKADAKWAVPTVKNILKNARYTGFEVWGRQTREETLLDPEDPSWGNKTRFVRSENPPTRSRKRVHDSIVTLEVFAQVQLILDSKSKAVSKGPSIAAVGKPVYPLRRVLYCATCGRAMEARPLKGTDREHPLTVSYRCRPRDLGNANPAKAQHGREARITQAEVLGCVQEWLGNLLSLESRRSVVNGLRALDSRPTATSIRLGHAQKRLADATKAADRLIQHIEDGTWADSMVPRLNALTDEQAALEAEIAAFRASPKAVSVQEVEALLDRFANAADQVFGSDADFAELNEFFRAICLRVDYDRNAQMLYGTVTWGVDFGDSASALGLPSLAVSWRKVDGTWAAV